MTIMAIPVMIVPVRTTIGDAKHAFHATNRAPDAGTDGPANHAADRSGRTVAAIGTFACAADDTLRMCCEWHCQHRQKRKGPKQAPLLRGLHGQNRCCHHSLILAHHDLNVCDNMSSRQKFLSGVE